jgi:hypothetical protein
MSSRENPHRARKAPPVRPGAGEKDESEKKKIGAEDARHVSEIEIS